ncbi:MAG: hypothetical protein EP334_09410 [Gammaproteobacteria bacterium]|nr:MAG: hypothetical protein EP334_09410 [Gammaproteobacteria bacterium]
MKYSSISLLLGCGLLVACASQNDQDDSYVGWVCNGPRNSDEWSCEMREVKDGQSVVRQVSKREGAEAPSDSEPGRDPRMEVAGLPSQDWRQQLPSLTSEPVIPPGDSVVQTARPRALSPRVAEPMPIGVPAPQQGGPVDAGHPVVVQVLADTAEPLRAEDVSGARSGYTLQLGAFADVSQLRAFISSHQLNDLAVREFQTVSQQQHWQVLTWGEFESPEEARRAWQQVSERYPGIEPWVRSMSSLDNAAGAAAAADG